MRTLGFALMMMCVLPLIAAPQKVVVELFTSQG
jgi:hypothetical protein